MIKYKAYEKDNGSIEIVKEGGEADQIYSQSNSEVNVLGLDQDTENDGSPLPPQTSLLRNSGRFYCYTDRRWITDSDDLYGHAYFQFAESGGSGANPILEWEHNGMVIPAGKTLSKLHFIARCNSTQVTDFEISVQARKPNPITGYESGVDADGEMTSTEVFRGNFVQPGFTGNMGDKRYTEIDLGDFVANDTCEVSIYIKPIGSLSTTRYIYATYTYEVY